MKTNPLNEITNSKKLEDLLTPKGFESLLHKILLFKEDSDFFKLSGYVTAALLDYETDDKGEAITVLAIQNDAGWLTHKCTRKWLTEMFSHCEAVAGKTPEESFTIL